MESTLLATIIITIIIIVVIIINNIFIIIIAINSCCLEPLKVALKCLICLYSSGLMTYHKMYHFENNIHHLRFYNIFA